MNWSKVFFYFGLSFILGVFGASVTSLDFYFSFLFLLLSACFFILSWANKYFIFLAIIFLAFFCGSLRFQLDQPSKNQSQINYYNDQQVSFAGVVNKEPDQRQDQVKLEVKAQKILIGSKWQKVQGKVLVSNYLFPEFQYGDQLKITCQLKTPQPINDFAYDKYLARYHIYSLCYYPKIELMQTDQGNFVLAGIYKIKNHFVSHLNQVLPEPQASFLAGLLIGAKKSIPPDLAQVFNQTGTTHIIAVSGYNVTIIAVFLMLFLQQFYLSRKKSFWLVVAALLIFMIITGLQASIIRATIMGLVVLLAGYLGRLSKLTNVLVLTAMIMLLINPWILVFDLGFQLSFLATLGLVYLNPILIKFARIEKIKSGFIKLILGDYFLTTMAAIIVTTPLILYQFGKLSLIAPLANILILPFIPVAMLLGFITGIFSLIWQPFAWIIGWSVWLVLTYIIWILETLAKLNWSYWEFESIGLGLMVFLYLVIGGVIILNSKSQIPKKV